MSTYAMVSMVGIIGWLGEVKMGQPQKFFVSDFHFSHANILNFERHQFNTIEEHDQYLVKQITEWSERLPKGSTLYNLGDFGSTDYLWTTDILRNAGINCIFIYGNHDSKSDLEKFEAYFDEVYQYPIYLSQKLVISHYPVAVFEDTINVHGHLHGSVLDQKNYITCSINDINYKPVSEQQINGRFAQLPKFNRRFLWEPFAGLMKFKEKRDDVVMDKDGRIDLAASRVLQKINKKKG